MKPREGKRALRPRHVFIDSELNCPSQFQKHSFFFFPQSLIKAFHLCFRQFLDPKLLSSHLLTPFKSVTFAAYFILLFFASFQSHHRKQNKVKWLSSWMFSGAYAHCYNMFFCESSSQGQASSQPIIYFLPINQLKKLHFITSRKTPHVIHEVGVGCPIGLVIVGHALKWSWEFQRDRF